MSEERKVKVIGVNTTVLELAHISTGGHTILRGIKTGEGTPKDLHIVSIAAETGVHVTKIGVYVISIPGTDTYTCTFIEDTH